MNHIYVDSDTLFQITDLKNARTLTEINDATIKVEVLKNDEQIGDDIELTAVGSNGNYYGAIPADLGLTVGDIYFLLVTISSNDGTLVKKIKVEAVYSE